jgi:hypothetical protein
MNNMKINWILISYSIALLLCLKSYGNDLSLKQRIGMVPNSSISELSALANDCETLWPSNASIYFQYEYWIESNLAKSATNNPVALEALESQVGKIVDKDCLVATDSGNFRFRAKNEIIELFVSVSHSKPNLQGAQILAKHLGEVRATIIKNYQFQPTPTNLPPPVILVRPGFYRLDTNASPAYLKAFKAMYRTNDVNRLQLHILPAVNQEMTSDFFNYSKALFAQNPQLKSQANNLAALAHLTSSEQMQLDGL